MVHGTDEPAGSNSGPWQAKGGNCPAQRAAPCGCGRSLILQGAIGLRRRACQRSTSNMAFPRNDIQVVIRVSGSSRSIPKRSLTRDNR